MWSSTGRQPFAGGGDHPRPRRRGRADGARGAGEPIGTRGLPAGIFASLALLATVDVLTAYLPVLGVQRGIPPAVVGALPSLRTATSILPRVLTSLDDPATPRGPAARRQRRRVRLLTTAGFLLGIGIGIGQPLTMSMAVHAVPSGTRGTALAIRLIGNRFGQVATPAAAGLVAGSAGVSAASGCSGASSAWPPSPSSPAEPPHTMGERHGRGASGHVDFLAAAALDDPGAAELLQTCFRVARA
jgi:hypothetical protein